MKRSRNRNQRERALAGVLSLAGSDSKHVRTVTVEPSEKPETIHTFRAKYDAEQKAEAANRIRAERASAGSVLLTEENSEFLASLCGKMNPAWETKPNAELCDAVKRAFIQFRDSLQDITILDNGIKKIASVTHKNWGLAWDNPATFAVAFQLMQDGGLLDNTTDIIDLRVPDEQPAPQTQPQAQDIDSINVETPEGRQQMKERLESDYYGNTLYHEWLAQLARDYSFTPNEQQARAAVQWFSDSNKSLLSHAAFHECRRAMVSRGVFPSHMLTPDEKLSMLVENSDMDDFEIRRKFQQASQRIHA